MKINFKKNKIIKLFNNTGYVLKKNKKEKNFDKSCEHYLLMITGNF